MSKATGDLYNSLIKLKKSLKTIKYTSVDNDELTIGSPKEYLKLYHYLMIDYNPQIAIDILNKYQIEFNNKNDKTFIDLIYKLMRDWLNYKPSLTKEQFFTTGFAELKALMTRDLIDLIYKKYKFNGTSTGGGGAGASLTASTNLHRSNSVNSRPAGFTNENYREIKSALLKQPISSSATNNKTPLVHNHRILNNHNLNLAVNVHHQPPSSSHKHINEEKQQQPAPRKENLLEILTKDDSTITYNDSIASSREGDTQIMKSLSSSSVVTIMANSNHHLNDDLNNKLDRVTNRIESLETFIKTNKRDNDDVELVQKQSTITISLKDYENLIARLSLLETKVLMLEQEQTLLKKQNTSSLNAYSTNAVSSNPQTQSSLFKQTQQQAAHIQESLSKKRISINTDVAQTTASSQPQPTTPNNDDYDDEATLYETPFVSFMNNSNSNEDLRLSRGAGSIGGGGINSVFNSHATPNANSITKALLAQGILTTTTTDTSVNEHDLSISQHDLTPTIEDPTNANDILHRARSLLNKASNLNEELKVKI